MIHGFTFEVHKSSPIVHCVCEGYDTVEAAVEAVAEGVVCSFTWSPQSFAQCPVLPQFLHVLMSMELVLVVLGFAFSFPLPSCESRLASGHHLRSLHLDEELHCWDNCKLFLRKISAMFIITVCLTASANAVPEAHSHSLTSSSQVLKPDSKPSVVSQEIRRPHDLLRQNVPSVLSVWRISAVCLRRHASAPLDSSRSDKSSDTGIKANEQFIYFQHFG